MSHFHGRKLEEAFPKGHTAQEELPVTTVATAVLMLGASSASPNSIHILVTLARVFSKIDPSPKHAPNIGVSLIKALLCNRLDEWRSMEKHSLIALIVILLSNLSPPVAVFLPQFGVPDLLYLENAVIGENAPSMPLVSVFPDSALHLLLDSPPLGVLIAYIHQHSALA